MISSLAGRGHCSICHSSLFSSREDRWEAETLGDLEGTLGVNHALVKALFSACLAWGTHLCSSWCRGGGGFCPYVYFRVSDGINPLEKQAHLSSPSRQEPVDRAQEAWRRILPLPQAHSVRLGLLPFLALVPSAT